MIGHSFYPKRVLKASLFALMLRGAITPKCGLLSRDYTHARAGPGHALQSTAHNPWALPNAIRHYPALPSDYPHQTRRAWQAAQIITLGCWGVDSMHIHRPSMRMRRYLHPHVVHAARTQCKDPSDVSIYLSARGPLNEPQCERLLGLPTWLDLDRYAIEKRSTLV